MEYRKKPVVIEAFQLTAETRASNESWPSWAHEAWSKDMNAAGALYPDPDDKGPSITAEGPLFIRTLEGEHRADIGDWIIRGVKGELYPCKPDIFELTYDPVELGARPKLQRMFSDLRQRIAALGQARDVSIALTHLDTAEKWARDYWEQPADFADQLSRDIRDGKASFASPLSDGKFATRPTTAADVAAYTGGPSPGSRVSPPIDNSAYNRRADEAD